MDSHARTRTRGQLRETLLAIEAADMDYPTRYPLVFHALSQALQMGYPAGIGADGDEPGWPVAYIELPEGQVSWHMPLCGQEWDGHTTAEKYQRIRRFADG